MFAATARTGATTRTAGRRTLPAGLIAFYNEKVDMTFDGVQLARPKTHFT